jgi:hypothetical protein
MQPKVPTASTYEEDNFLCNEEQEQPVTFQIAMVGNDGLVIGTDSLGRYAAAGQIAQQFSVEKYFISHSGSLICFCAGTNTAVQLARQLSLDCDSVVASDLSAALFASAAKPRGMPVHSPIDDEILVAHTRIADRFWFITRKPGFPAPTIFATSDFVCTGAKTPAIFLPRHLWRGDRSTSELKKLALLTLAYATMQEPGSVGPPYTVMTVAKNGNIEWSQHDQAECGLFQAGLERLFSEWVSSTAP